MKILWFLPTPGDGHYLGTSEGGRPLTHGYLQQIAKAADELGYYGILVPTGNFCEDPWVVASSLIPVTNKLKFLVALRTGVYSPTVIARKAATFDRLSGGRLLINVVAGGDPVELEGDGIFLDHDERYEDADEFLTIWKSLLAGEEVDYKGKYREVSKGKQLFPAVQKPYPPLFFGGSSKAGHEVAAKHVDYYLSWGEPIEQVRQKIAEVRKLAEAQNRTLRFGLRAHVIVRKTEEEAWQAADQLIEHLDDSVIEEAQKVLSRYDSEGQKRMSSLHHNGNRDSLKIGPNLWAGIGLVRGGAGTALVGDPDSIVARLKEYEELGIDTFVLSGYPHLEEAYRVAELLFPRLGLHPSSSVEGPVISPFVGEVSAQHPEKIRGGVK